LTADAKATAATTRVEVFLASTRNEIKGALGEAREVSVTINVLGLLVSNDKELIHGDIAISTNTNGVELHAGNLCLGVVSGSLEISTTSKAVLSAVVTIDIMVVVTVSEDDQNFLHASTAELELINTKTHANRDGGTTAAARGGHVGAGGATLKGRESSLDIGLAHTLRHGQGSPRGSIEVDKSKVCSEGSISKCTCHADDEGFLVDKLGLVDRAGAIKDESNVNRLTTLATRGHVENGGRRCAPCKVGEGVLTEVLEFNTADLVVCPVELGNVARSAGIACIFVTRDAVDDGILTTASVGAGNRGIVYEHLRHGHVHGASLAGTGTS